MLVRRVVDWGHFSSRVLTVLTPHEQATFYGRFGSILGIFSDLFWATLRIYFGHLFSARADGDPPRACVDLRVPKGASHP